MRILIAAIGRLKDGADRELCSRYASRLDNTGKGIALGPAEIAQFNESREATADSRKKEEATRLLKASERSGFRFVLHEHGRTMASEVFARKLADLRDDGIGEAAFLIGGPDGHGAAVLDAADFTLSIGPMTLPHGLARIVLAEQLYRAATIISGHPYHRT